MKKYLKNNICDFVELKPIDYNNKKNIISISLFKMHTGGYKDFSQYLDGILIISKIAKKYDLSIRIFIDDSIYKDLNIMTYLNNFDNITLILYKCKDFIIEDYHVGLFGTLIRFFPLFDFENNDSKIVFVSDADAKESTLLEMINYFEMLKKNNLLSKINLAYKGRFINNNGISSKKLIYNNTKIYLPYCIAPRILSINKINKYPLIKYIKILKKYMDEKTRPTKILSDYPINETNFNKLCENNLCFGLDEYFINNVLFKYVVKKNIPFCYFHNFDLSRYYYYRHPNYVTKNIHLVDIPLDDYINLFNTYMKKIGLDKYSYKTIDKNIYIDTDKNTDTKKVATKFIEMYAKKMINLFKILIDIKNYNIFNKYQLFSLKLVDYKKYFILKYIHFINYDHDDIIVDYVKYSNNFIKSFKKY